MFLFEWILIFKQKESNLHHSCKSPLVKMLKGFFNFYTAILAEKVYLCRPFVHIGLINPQNLAQKTFGLTIDSSLTAIIHSKLSENVQ